MQGKLIFQIINNIQINLYNYKLFQYLNFSVGKTSLLNRYSKNEFSLKYKETIGADFLTKLVERGEDTIQLQLWDTAGTEKYHSMGSSFYRNTEACILVFDLTNPDTFKSIENWRTTFLDQLNPSEPNLYPFILIGNKSDLNNNIQNIQSEIDNFCKEHNNMPFFMTSAKDNINLEEAFNKIIDLALEKNAKSDENFVPSKNLKLVPEKPKKKKKCC